jgi:exodeoxyribonuclease VII small subunit
VERYRFRRPRALPNEGLKCERGSASFAAVEAQDTKLSFEDALGRLEAIVESMESGDVPLAELLARFEEGTRLLKVCEGRLKEAELKIEQLKKQKDGSLGFEPFETERDA